MIKPPDRKQRLTLRLMILIGIGCMAFFAFYLLHPAACGYRPLYVLLIITFVFTAAKVLYEWYHYWDIRIDPQPPRGKVFTVDIFTTFCAGEPYEMIVETLEAIQAITYPHETYLCDEADDPYLKEVCRKLGVHHVTRVEKIDAKAGNINNALKQSKGELCVVLDPDHVPFPDFLDPIVDHFNNPEIGYVQIVQAYSNQDQGWIAKGAAQQTYQYYGPMMMTMNAYGTAQAIGANCTFRRKALESIGGHAAGLAEDMHTSMQLHARGWKSVYVPAVLSRGLVPATLSAYYKQQLKWSRGVFELFVTSYITLFRKFNWRQKVHYGLVPMFYLSGFIYLLNFIIPIASLLGDVYPLRMDFSVFTIVTIPFITSVLLIRHFVQRWVMEDQERGFHVIGGLLLIGTWWVFIVGFVYTLMRKKVPYIPTPKDISEERNLRINLPNIIVFGISLVAILYGLYNDWNPYTLIMAGICAINCCFMVFMLFASEQQHVKDYQRRHRRLSAVSSRINAFKRRFWLLRREVYVVLRMVSLPLMVLSICFAYYVSEHMQEHKPLPAATTTHKNILLTGIFDPSAAGDGLTALSRINTLQQREHVHFDIVSIYLAWGDQPKCNVPVALLDSIYHQHATPLITWEPWQALFNTFGHQKDEYVFANILEGKYDAYITRTAQQLRSLNRPVFLRFAHEADNPAYPWSATGKNTPEDFKAAWKYIHDLFIARGAWNVTWVWNPWKAEAATSYFPGKDYVDWIGITGLNYGPYSAKGRSFSFKELYTPFHRLKLNRLDIPVMIAEMGTVKSTNQTAWLSEGMESIRKEFQEVKAVILFNSAYDVNVPDRSVSHISWRQDRLAGLWPFDGPHHLPYQPAAAAQQVVQNSKSSGFATNTRGVLYTKGQNWHGNTYAITRRTIVEDFEAMRRLGLNTVKFYGPGIYDRITLKAARQTGLQAFYSFWVPDPAVLLTDSSYLPKLSEEILATVAELKDNPQIHSWNIGNCTFQQMDGVVLQPELFYRRQAYTLWLKTLIREIKAIDPGRAVTVDVQVGGDLLRSIAQLHDQVPEIDAFGLVWNEEPEDSALIRQLTVPYYFSSVNPGYIFKFKGISTATVLENWQDQQTGAGVGLNGLKDMQGRIKPELIEVARNWSTNGHLQQLPKVKILRPSLATVPGDMLPYNALVNISGRWHLAKYEPAGLRFEWYQVRTDQWGTPLEITRLGNEPVLKYRIPENPRLHRLYLIATDGKQVSTAYTILNIPLQYEKAPVEN